MELGAIERTDLATSIAEKLRLSIVSGVFRPGDRLPSERKLADVLQVTRTTLREALKVLETLKFIRIRQGDGVKVLDYMRGANLEILADLLFRDGTLDSALFRNILEARGFFGRTLARLAAMRATKEQIRNYSDMVERLASAAGDPPAMQEIDLDCFELLAQSSDNLVFVFVLNSIRSIYLSHKGVFERLYEEPDRLIEGHGKVLAAIRAREPAAAEAAMGEMLDGPEGVTKRGENG
ncbi:MAG: FadR family transcriptional regulator [Deltaproteobacteria bacterium]|nr:FadR family transcriptional regulator [Deltaproteobacteria bacterium]